MQEKAFDNKTEFRIIGMSRSGNHSIINWIIKQLKGFYCFLNCADPKANPFHTAHPMAGGKTYRTNIPGFDLAAEQAGRFSRKDYLIYSYEDCFLGMVQSGALEAHHDEWLGRSGRVLDILILRDPFNLFASRQKAGYSGITPLTAKRVWKQHAREFMERRYLTGSCVLIRYNAWATDGAYRRRLAERLGLRFTDAGFNDVSSCGGGSSFDGMEYDGRAAEMNVLARWRYYKNDPEYRKQFDREIVEMAKKIFGPIPGMEELRLKLQD